VTVVHQATGVAGRYDAVTGQLLAYAELLRRWGLEGGRHALRLQPGAPTGLKPLSQLAAAPDDVVLIHYSGWVAGMEALLQLPQRKLLVYHNITPARYFWAAEPIVAVVCELGRDQLPRLVAAADVSAAVSAYNADELRQAGAHDPAVVPILLDPARFPIDGGARPAPGAEPVVLSVGRLAPHKRPDLLIRAFALYQRAHAPAARLLCVGPPLHPGYLRRLEELVHEVGATGVELVGSVSDAELGRAYAQASVLLSLSEHEGFCIPLLEAFHAGLPVVARPVGGMPEVGGDAVLWVEDDDLAVVAELVHLAVSDAELRGELSRRARARSERFAYERVAEEVRGLVEAGLP
jgi:L-malate glycosyltransferase